MGESGGLYADMAMGPVFVTQPMAMSGAVDVADSPRFNSRISSQFGKVGSWVDGWMNMQTTQCAP